MKKLLGLFLLIITSVSVMASEKSVYEFSWLDKDKEVYVLQNRKFRKASTVYLGTTFGKSLSGAFVDRYTGSLYGGYFFSENWGIELSYNKASNTKNATHDAVNTAGAVAFYRQIDSDMTAHIVWSPFYSKINTFNKIIYYDWLFGAGVSSITTQDNRNEFKSESDSQHDELTSESSIAYSWFTGFRFFITENWSTRVDFKGTHSNADRAIDSDTANQFDIKKSWFHYYDFKLGINYTF
jgi:outer membrane beta-barrel protein